jgi:hypothetical protein
MLAPSYGELAMVVFIFGLVWGAAVLPRLGERIAGRRAERRARASRGTG